jgi:hypothetical protein
LINVQPGSPSILILAVDVVVLRRVPTAPTAFAFVLAVACPSLRSDPHSSLPYRNPYSATTYPPSKLFSSKTTENSLVKPPKPSYSLQPQQNKLDKNFQEVAQFPAQFASL